MEPKISVIVVDDSALVRGLLRRIIEKDPSLDIVSSCADGGAAVSDYKRCKPDLVLLDVEMPNMDGIECLSEILKIDPCAKVVMCSSLTQKGSATAFKALKMGALECLGKPSSGDIDRGEEFERKLLTTLKTLGNKDVVARPVENAHVPKPTGDYRLKDVDHKGSVNYNLAKKPDRLSSQFPSAIVIGASTGGPKALPQVLKELPENLSVPVFITQHVPKGFAELIAQEIGRKISLPVHVATEGMSVKPGNIYLAPAGVHLCVSRNGGNIVLEDSEPVNFCKPSINVMFDSVHKAFGPHIMALLLTGMGEDGKDAVNRMHDAADTNIILAQDEASSVVWGIPGAVARAGLCHGVFPLSVLGEKIKALLWRDLAALE